MVSLLTLSLGVVQSLGRAQSLEVVLCLRRNLRYPLLLAQFESLHLYRVQSIPSKILSVKHEHHRHSSSSNLSSRDNPCTLLNLNKLNHEQAVRPPRSSVWVL